MRSILPTGDADSNYKLFFLLHKEFPAEPCAVPCLASPRIVNFELEHMTEPTTNQPVNFPVSPRFLPLLLLLFVGSGCAALIYEIVWFQLLQLVIGSTAVSLGVLLGTFMGGMCA